MRKLGLYDYQLERLTYTYEKLSLEMNNAAISSQACEAVAKSATSVADSFLSPNAFSGSASMKLGIAKKSVSISQR